MVISLDKHIYLVYHYLMPTQRSGKVWQEVCHFLSVLQFMYSFFHNFEFCPHIASISHFFSKRPPRVSSQLTKKLTEKNWGHNHTHSIYVPLVIIFCANGSLPDTGNWWCLRLGVGAFQQGCSPSLWGQSLMHCLPNCSC